MTGIIGLVRADGLSTEALIDALSQNDRVLYAEPNYVFNVAAESKATGAISGFVKKDRAKTAIYPMIRIWYSFI